jgi:predicted cupin superfamily sugar epimerase
MNDDVDALVTRLGLRPHPEGGFYRETFRSSLTTPTAAGERAASTAIYYLLPAGARSALHRVRSDEVWHFYGGQSITIHLLDNAGGHRERRLGPDLQAGEEPQLVVPANVWQAAIGPEQGYALCGCTVAPGFDFADFEMPSVDVLRRLFPDRTALVEQLARTRGQSAG